MAKPSLFSIDDDLTDQGYEAVGAQVLHFQLRSTVGVRSAQLQVWDANAYNPALGDILENPPRSSPSAPALTLDNGATTGQAVNFSPLSGEITCTLPNGVTASWLVRCVINGGQRVVNGVVVRDPELIHERMVVIRSGAGLRQLVATETRQESDHGVAKWAEEVLAALGAVATASAGDWKPSVRAATTAALPAYTRNVNVITANANGALPAIDGITLQAGDRLLLLHGAAAADNGIYVVTAVGSGGSTFVLTRADDADTSAEVTPGMRVPVEEGTLNSAKVLKLTTTGAIVLNTTGLSFSRENDLPNGSANTDVPQWNGSSWTPTSNPTVTSLAAAAFLAIGAANLPASGAVRMAHGSEVTGRNNADTQTRSVAGWGVVANDVVHLGDVNEVTRVRGSRVDFYAGANQTGRLGKETADYLAVGPTPATSGSHRFSHGSTIAGRDNGNANDRAVLTWGVEATDVVGLGGASVVTRVTGSAMHAYVGATCVAQLGATTTDYLALGTTGNLPGAGLLRLGEAAGIVWGKAVASPSCKHEARTTDAATTSLTLQAQSAWVSATGTNRNGGTLHLRSGNAASGGTAGYVTLGEESGDLVHIHRAAGTYCGFTSGGIATSGFGFYANNSGQTIFFQALGTSGSIQLSTQSILAHYGASGATILQVSGTTWSLQITEATGASTLRHNARTSDAATVDLTVQAQSAWASATGSNRKGGDLLLKAGQTTSGGAESKVRIFTGATNGALTEGLTFSYDSPTSMTILGCANGHLKLQPETGSAALYLRSGSSGTGDVVIDTMGTTGVLRLRTGAGGDPILTCVNKNAALFSATGSYGGGVGVLFGSNATTEPTSDPVGGGLVWWYGGAFKGRGSSGTITTIAAADPHCPRCGNDYVFEARNPARGHHVAICWTCFLATCTKHGIERSDFAFIDRLGKVT